MNYIFRLNDSIKRRSTTIIPIPAISVYRIPLISDRTQSGIFETNLNKKMKIPNNIIKIYVSQGFMSIYPNDLSFDVWNELHSFKVFVIFIKTMGSCLSRMICLSNFLSRQLPTYITSGV